MASADRVDLLCAFIKWHGSGSSRSRPRADRPRRPAARHHDDLHRRHRSAGPRPARRARRRGQGLVRDPHDPPARQGVAVPPRRPAQHGVRRLVEPVPSGHGRRPGVERAGLRARAAAPPGHVRARRSTSTGTTRRSRHTTRRGTANGCATRARRGARPRADRPAARDHDAGRPSVPLPAGDPRRADAERRCTAGGATWSSWPPAPARRSSPPSTTGGCARRERSSRCCSSPIRSRSSGRAVGVPARAARRHVRRALRRRRAADRVAARLRLGPVAAPARPRRTRPGRDSTW